MKYKKSDIAIKIIKYICVLVAVLSIILPLIVVFFGSFKTNEELFTTNPLTLPKNFFYLENYKAAWSKGHMARGFFNTIIIVTTACFATILTGTMTAYVLSRFKTRYKWIKQVTALFLIASLVPGITMQMSVFQIIVGLGLYGSRLSVILLFAGTDIISIYIFLQFLENISISLDEAAIIDGASFPRTFFSIIFPLLKPAIITVLILKGIGFYNEFYTPYLYMKDKRKAVVSTALFAFKGPYGSKWEIICAGCVITMIPTFIIFLFLQKRIYSGLTSGSVKG